MSESCTGEAGKGAGSTRVALVARAVVMTRRAMAIFYD